MLRLWRVGFAAALLFTRVGWAQIDVHAIEHDLKGKPMALRSYSAETVARYEWVNDKLVLVAGHYFTLGAFTTQSVKLKGNKLIFEGTRGTIMRDAQRNILGRTGDASMKLEVDLHNAPMTLQIPTLENMLFVEDTATAIAGLPMPFSKMLPLDTKGKLANCDCIMIFDDSQWMKTGENDSELLAPKLRSSAEPVFSDEAREKKISGAVVVVVDANNTGHVEDVWLAQPLGFGLDEEAFKTVRKYVFDPSTYKGRPVGTIVKVVVVYQAR